MATTGEQVSEKNVSAPTHQYNSQFAPRFVELQENQRTTLPLAPEHDTADLEVEPDTGRSQEATKAQDQAASAGLEQVAPGLIQYSKFKCRDLNKSMEKPGRRSSLPASGGPANVQVISFEEMHKFKDRYEITKNTGHQQTKVQKLVA